MIARAWQGSRHYSVTLVCAGATAGDFASVFREGVVKFADSNSNGAHSPGSRMKVRAEIAAGPSTYHRPDLTGARCVDGGGALTAETVLNVADEECLHARQPK